MSGTSELVGKVHDAAELIERFGQIDGAHHKTWVIDQVQRILLGEHYDEWRDAYEADGEYSYDEGIAP